MRTQFFARLWLCIIPLMLVSSCKSTNNSLRSASAMLDLAMSSTGKSIQDIASSDHPKQP